MYIVLYVSKQATVSEASDRRLFFAKLENHPIIKRAMTGSRLVSVIARVLYGVIF